MIRLLLLIAMLACLTPQAPAFSGAAFEGPVRASVIRVLDGDTLRVLAHVWPGQTISINVRIRGVDAPEGRSRCAFEREAAARSTAALAALIGNGEVSLSNIAAAKYHGRVLADVTARDGRDVGRILLDFRLVRPYLGGRRKSWC